MIFFLNTCLSKNVVIVIFNLFCATNTSGTDIMDYFSVTCPSHQFASVDVISVPWNSLVYKYCLSLLFIIINRIALLLYHDHNGKKMCFCSLFYNRALLTFVSFIVYLLRLSKSLINITFVYHMMSLVFSVILQFILYYSCLV